MPMCQKRRNCDADEPLYEAAVRIVLEEREASIGLVQRRLKLGYSRVVEIFHRMEMEGIVGATPANGNRREILITPFKRRLMLQGSLCHHHGQPMIDDAPSAQFPVECGQGF